MAIVAFAWLYDYRVEIFLLVCALLISFQLVIAAAWCAGRERVASRWLALWIAGVWLVLVTILDRTPIGAAWIELAVLVPTNRLTPIVGGAGVSALLVVINAGAATWFATRCRRSGLVAVAAAGVLAAGALAAEVAPREPGDRSVVLVQGAFAESWMWRVRNAHSMFDRQRALTLEAVGHNSDALVVWPEYAVPVDVVTQHADLGARLLSLQRFIGAPLLVGSLLHLPGTDDHVDAAVLFDEGRLRAVVPSVEPVFFNENTVASKRSEPLLPSPLRPGVLICYEETKPSLVRRVVARGARLLVTVFNHQDFSDRGQRLALGHARLRAAESRRFLVRAGNTGITAVIDPLGRVVEELDAERGVLRGSVRAIDGDSFYVSTAGLAPLAALLLLALLARSRNGARRFRAQ